MKCKALIAIKIENCQGEAYYKSYLVDCRLNYDGEEIYLKSVWIEGKELAVTKESDGFYRIETNDEIWNKVCRFVVRQFEALQQSPDAIDLEGGL